MADKKYILALDQGTTSSRAMVVGEAGEVVSIAQRPFGQIFPQPGWVEHSPTEIWASQSGVATEALAAADLTERNRALDLANSTVGVEKVLDRLEVQSQP